MYRFSRSIYRELSPYVAEDWRDDGCGARQQLLESCEGTMRRLSCDWRHFARPTGKLFSDVRVHFPMHEQLRVYRVIERYVSMAVEHVERLAAHGISLDGRPRECLASTRKGTQCRREPLPGSDYCPSHKHLEEPFEMFERMERVGAAA
jgi:hypothetical protein